MTLLDASSMSMQVSCRTADDGSLMIGTDITQHFFESIMTAFGNIIRWEEHHLEPVGSATSIDVYSYADQRITPGP